MYNFLLNFIACGFGSGWIKWAPGTFGTVVGLIIYKLFYANLSLDVKLILFLFSLILGISICSKVAKNYQDSDPQSIVWDEIVGFWFSMLLLPSSWQGLLIGFVFFRLFDIAKPWPVSWADSQLSGGLSIMLDDFMAAVYVNLLVIVLNYFGLLSIYL